MDPSVEFGLRFETQVSDDDEDEDAEADAEYQLDAEDDGDDTPPSGGADVVRLDRWRK